MSDRERTHTCGDLRPGDEGKEVHLKGWVHRRRDHGGVIFADLRDRFGLTQVVFKPEAFGPSPSPFAPWHDLQFFAQRSLPLAITAASVSFTGAFIALYLSGAGQGFALACWALTVFPNISTTAMNIVTRRVIIFCVFFILQLI